jgi:hypothetical protein
MIAAWHSAPAVTSTGSSESRRPLCCARLTAASVGKGPQRGARGGLRAPLGPGKIKKAGFRHPWRREFTGSFCGGAPAGSVSPRVSRARRGPPSCPARQVAGPAERESAHRPRYSLSIIPRRGPRPGASPRATPSPDPGPSESDSDCTELAPPGLERAAFSA